MVARIATGEIEEPKTTRSPAAELGSKGGKSRAAKLSPEKTQRIAKQAAKHRWGEVDAGRPCHIVAQCRRAVFSHC
jgi:hypothetical protein